MKTAKGWMVSEGPGLFVQPHATSPFGPGPFVETTSADGEMLLRTYNPADVDDAVNSVASLPMKRPSEQWDWKPYARKVSRSSEWRERFDTTWEPIG